MFPTQRGRIRLRFMYQRDFTKSLKQKKEKQAKREQWTGCHSGEVLSSSSHERTGKVSDLVV